MPKLTAGENVTLTINVGADTLTVDVLSETIRDLIAGFLVAGGGITVTHDDPGNTLTVAATGPDTETIRDLIGTVMVAGNGLVETVDDPGNTVTFEVDAEFLSTLILATILPGTGITTEVDEVANTITISAPENLGTEDVQDVVGAMLAAGAGISLSYNDTTGVLTITSTITQYTDEMARDALGAAIVAGTGVSVTVNDPGETITVASTITQYTDEQVRDVIGAALVAGTNITITVNDAGDTITIDAAGGSGYTAENARDDIGAALVAGTGISITVSDVGDTITIASTLGSSYTQEDIEDIIANLIVAGNGIKKTYNDAGGTLTLEAEGGLWLPPPSGRLITLMDTFGGSPAQAATSSGRMYATPIVVTKQTTFDRISIQTFNTTASNIRLGVFAIGSDGLPGALVQDCGVIATSTATYQAITLSPNLTLDPGRYFLVYLSDGTTSVYMNNGNLTPFGNVDANLSSSSNRGLPYKTQAYGALPDPFGAITAYVANSPIVALRVA